MQNKIIYPFLFFLILSLPIAFARDIDFTATISPSSVNLRSGDSTNLQGKVENTNWLCDIQCSYTTSQGKNGDIGYIENGNEKSFSVEVTAPTSGVSPKEVTINVYCFEPSCGDSRTDSKYVDIYFTYCGDGNSDQGYETCSNCPSDVICQSGYICMSGQCVIKCGNGQIDSGETCSSCPQDVQCSSGTRCESGECVAYCGNNICESNENCFTCASDCACSSGYECKSGICEKAERCGNGDCSSSESCSSCPNDCGKCPSVCGDKVCETDESCSSCPSDCGQCPPIQTPQQSIKNTEENTEQTNNAKEIPQLQENIPETKQKQENVKDVSPEKDYKEVIKNPYFIGGVIIILVSLLVLFPLKKWKETKKLKKGLLKVCSKCGKKLNLDDFFCIKCGKKIKKRK